MKKKKEIENRHKKTVMSLLFLTIMAIIYLILYILSWVPLYPECIQVPVLLVSSNMEK